MMVSRPARLAHVALASFAALTGSGTPVRAEPDPKPWFLLRIAPCVRVDSEATAQQVSTELGRLRSRAQASAGPVVLRVSCQGEKNLLVARLPGSGTDLIRTLDVHLQPDELRERILALAVAELLAASAAEADPEGARSGAPIDEEEDDAHDAPDAHSQNAAGPAPASAGSSTSAPVPSSPSGSPAPPPPPSAVTTAPRRPAFPAFRILALASYQVFLRETLGLVGGGVGVGWDSSRHVGLTLDVLARHGVADLGLGSISVDTVSLGATTNFFFGWTRLRLRAGGGLRGGMVRLHGQPADPARTKGDSFFGGWLGPALALGATGRIGRRIALELTAEGGYVVLPVIGQTAGSPDCTVSIAGPFLGLQLGIGVFP